MDGNEQLKELITSLKDDVKQGFLENREDHKNIKLSYVTKDRFLPVEKIVYGGVGLILLTVLGAIIATVVKAST